MGWSNSSCKVISWNIYENKVGNRGSKSALFSKQAVKERRVNNCWGDIYLSPLKCILMGFEINYQVKIPINQTNQRQFYSSKSSLIYKDITEPLFITGFTDSFSRRKYSTKVNNSKELNLVIWGSNLTSQLGTGKFTKIISSIIKLPDYYNSVVVGCYYQMGD
jgi:hypothetical protein